MEEKEKSGMKEFLDTIREMAEGAAEKINELGEKDC